MSRVPHLLLVSLSLGFELQQPACSRADAPHPLDDTDIVLWYTLGVTHLPRPEEWPLMPAHRAGFKLVPAGFFARNPLMKPGS